MAGNQAIPEHEQQPTRRAVSETTRKFDQTYLDPNAEIIHRDYAAHFFRWGFTKDRWIAKERSNVLDVGCGPDRPLMLALFGGIGAHFPKSYTGVDLSRIKPTKHARSVLYPETNFVASWKQILKERGPFHVITNFEVIEHMPVAEGAEMLKAFAKCLEGSVDASHPEGGVLILSTPVYDGKARAKNHIHEYTIPELQASIEKAGFRVLARYGTFMNANDIKRVATPAEKEVWNALRAYYSNDVLSTFLAPLHPDHSRNNVWVCGLKKHDLEEQKKALLRAEAKNRAK